MTNAMIDFAPALPAGANHQAAEAAIVSGRRLLRPLPGRVLAGHVLLFIAGIACGIAVTAALRIAAPRAIQIVSAFTAPAAVALDMSDPVYDLKRMPQPVWHISAPLEVEIERAKRDLEAALLEGRK